MAAESCNFMSKISKITRRGTLVLSATTAASFLLPAAEAAEGPELHGISAFGDLKYPADFKQFDYVNPNAPKGGVFSHVAATRIFNQNLITFNSFNSFILKGDAAQGMELTFASLMTRATTSLMLYMVLLRVPCGYRPTGSPIVS